MKAGTASTLALVTALLTTPFAAAATDPTATPPATATPAPIATPAPATIQDATPAPPAWLAPPSPAPAAVGKPEAPRSSWRSILLLLAVGGIGGAAFYMRRRKQTRLVAPTTSRLQIVETVRVSPRAQVVLTQVNGRLLLLGVTDRSVHRIAWAGRVTDAPRGAAQRRDVNEFDDAAPTMRPKPAASPRPFQAMLDALKGARTSAPPPSDAALQIAAETTDTYERRSPANSNRLSSVPATTTTTTAALRSLEALVAAVPAAASVAPLEGQVSGLRRRAVKRKS